MLRLNVSSGRVLEQLELPVPLTGVPATLADFRTWENIPGLLKRRSSLCRQDDGIPPAVGLWGWLRQVKEVEIFVLAVKQKEVTHWK